MEFTTSNLINIGAYLITLGIFVGTIKRGLQNQLSRREPHNANIKFRKEKVEKHNQVMTGLTN